MRHHRLASRGRNGSSDEESTFRLQSGHYTGRCGLTLPAPMIFSAAYTAWPQRGHLSDPPNFCAGLLGLLVGRLDRALKHTTRKTAFKSIRTSWRPHSDGEIKLNILSEGNKNLRLLLDAQRLSSVHVQGSGAHAVAVPFGSVLFTITGFTVELVVMNGHGGAVQILPANH